MGAAVCLRCDWHGEIGASTCPDCGAPLYRSPLRQPDHASSNPSSAPGRFKTTKAPRPRQRGFLAAAGITVALATVAFLWVRANTPQAKVTDALSGTIVYAEDLGDGTSRLWRWDLVAGTAELGPRVQDPVELVDAGGADQGWVGVTSRRSRTKLQASVLRFLDPGEHPEPVARGDMIAWGPDGEGVAVAERGPVRGACRRHLAVSYVRLIPRGRERQFADDLCGDVLSVGRGGVVTYFTLQRGKAVRIVYVSVGLVRTAVRDFALIGASPVGDLLVVPASALPQVQLAPFGTRIDRNPPPTGVFGTALFFRGLETTPIPYGRGSDRFEIDRIMAWTPDGLTALVAGSLGERSGLFEVDGGPGGGLRAPRFVGSVEGLTWATYAGDGTAFVSSNAGISVELGGVLVPVDVPEGAAEPSGPIAWIS